MTAPEILNLNDPSTFLSTAPESGTVTVTILYILANIAYLVILPLPGSPAVADVAGRDVQPVWEESKQTRLGRGFYETRHLLADAIAATAETVAHFAQVARDHKATSVCAIATSAARDAVNPDDLISAVQVASAAASSAADAALRSNVCARGSARY